MPSPVSALRWRPSPGGASTRRLASSGARSALLNTSSSGTSPAPISASTVAHGVDLRLGIGGRRVDDVDEQVGLGHDLERGLERLDELVGQLADEADGVGEQHRLAAGQVEAAGRGVERGEQAVLDEHAGVGEPVEQRRLAGVGVADDRDTSAQAAARRALALQLARCGASSRSSRLELGDAAHEAPAVDLELRLARTDAGADAAAPAGDSVGLAPRRSRGRR